MYLIVLLPVLALAQNNESSLLNMTEITLKQGHETQFIEGVKLWKECYLENKGPDSWNLWRRVQGEGVVYIFTGRMNNWAEMDEPTTEVNKACRATIKDFIMPHVKSVNYNIARSIPEISRPPMADMKLVWVASFKVNNSTEFNSVIKDVTSSLRSIEGQPRGFWFNVMGGAPDQADYFVSIPFKNFAGLDIDVDGVWEVYEKVHGKKKTDATRAKFRASVDSNWSYIYTLSEEKSHQNK